MVVIALIGDKGIYKLLILSQVVLSLQLPFATIPLIHLTSDRKKMGAFASNPWVKTLAWATAGIIVALNLMLVLDEVSGWLTGGPAWVWVGVVPALALLIGVLGYLTFRPFFHPGVVWESGIMTATRAVAQRVEPVSFEQIGAALEHTEGDAKVISAAMGMARMHKARLILIHIVETPGTAMFGPHSQSLHGTEDEAYLVELAREIEDWDLPVHTMLRFGNPAEQLIKSVEEANIDLLLVLGSHGHYGLRDLLYGETATSVRHAVNIPVLIVRTEGLEKAQRKP